MLPAAADAAKEMNNNNHNSKLTNKNNNCNHSVGNSGSPIAKRKTIVFEANPDDRRCFPPFPPFIFLISFLFIEHYY